MIVTNRNIICFPTLAWGRNWERQHEIIYFLAGITSGKVYVHQPFGMINYGFAEIYKKVKSLRAELELEPTQQQNPLRDNMVFLRSKFVPRHHNILVDKFNAAQIEKATPCSFKDAIVFATYVNSFTFPLFKKAHFGILDLAARRQKLHELSAEFKALEKEAVATADAVFVDNIMTIGDYKSLNKNIFYMPQGVDSARFALKESSAELQKWRAGFTKVAGYSGSDIVMDYPLLHRLISENTDVLFLFVGDMNRPESHGLLQHKNVRFTGRINYAELGDYYQLFEVGLIPYLINDRTSGVFPTKLFEYLAAGKPVLTSALPDLKILEKDFIAVIQDEISAPAQLKSLLGKTISAQEMAQFVAENTWEARFNFMLETIKSGL